MRGHDPGQSLAEHPLGTFEVMFISIIIADQPGVIKNAAEPTL
jgi:hypothetical protein